MGYEPEDIMDALLRDYKVLAGAGIPMWNFYHYEKFVEICKELGLEFINLFESPLRGGNKPDARCLIAQYLTVEEGMKDKLASKYLGVDRSTIPFHREKFRILYESDKPFREKCIKLDIKPGGK